MLDYEKIGKFLRELREKNGFSQSQLGKNVYVTRQAVSQWELGKCFPDLQTATYLAEIYDITIADIYAGEIVKNKEKYNSIMEFVVKSEMKKSKKIITLLSASLILLMLLFFGYYFFNVYNKISVYTIDTIEEPYVVKGLITKSVNDIYVNFELNDTYDKICLMYNDDNVRCVNNSNYLVIKEKLGYNEQLPMLSNIKAKDLLNNLYVAINDNKIKLNVVNDYKNNNIFFNKDSSNTKYSEEYEVDAYDVPNKIKDTFEFDKDIKAYTKVNASEESVEKMTYYSKNGVLDIQKITKDHIKTWRYNLKDNTLELYTETENNNIVFEIKNEDDENYNRIKQKFEKEYIEKYIK